MCLSCIRGPGWGTWWCRAEDRASKNRLQSKASGGARCGISSERSAYMPPTYRMRAPMMKRDGTCPHHGLEPQAFGVKLRQERVEQTHGKARVQVQRTGLLIRSQ